MNRNKKRILTGIVTLIVIVVSYIVYGYIQKGYTGSVSIEKNNSALIYRNDVYGFYFSYPRTAEVNTTQVEDGEVIVINDTATQRIFQISIKPIEQDNIDITEDRLRADVPDMDVRDPQPVEITTGARGLAFISKDSSGEKREVWFAFNKFLYQISAPLNSDSFVRSTLNTWTFMNS